MKPIEIVLSKLDGIKTSGDSGRQWVACCPAHADQHQSLAVGVGSDERVLLNCYAGCSFQSVLDAAGLKTADVYPDGVDREPAVTVWSLAFNKRIPESFLKDKFGLSNLGGGKGVVIPYKDSTGATVIEKHRTNLIAKKGSRWPAGKPLMLYGRWLLTEARSISQRLWIVEGESDTWTFWYHGVPAIGVPGANAVDKTLKPDVLDGMAELCVWNDGDSSGDQFVQKVIGWVRQQKWQGKILEVNGGSVKDPSDIHRINPDQFLTTIEFRLSTAKVYSTDGNTVGGSQKVRQQKQLPTVPGYVADKIDQLSQTPTPTPRHFSLTDYGNAKRLIFRHGDNIRYCHEQARWLVWDGYRWQHDISEEVIRLAKNTVEAIHIEGRNAEKIEDRMALLQHASRSEDMRRLEAMVRSARSEAGTTVMLEALDNDPYRLNVVNGTIDLHTGELRRQDRNDMLTKLAPVAFDPKAKCPTWEQFLDVIMDGDADLVRFIQLAVGYSLTADVREKCFFFLYGTGSNGKTTLIETMQAMLGDYWRKTPAESLLARGDGVSGIPNDIARLPGARFVASSELSEGRQLDESKIKDLTGRDTIAARFMRSEWFEFRPTFKLWMYGNHQPQIKGSDDGIWRRLRLIPFEVVIHPDKQDASLPFKLLDELPGILAWSVRGCLDWQKEGLPIPKRVAESVQTYRNEQDSLADFVSERCFVHPEVSSAAGLLYSAYKQWCEGENQKPIGQRWFGSNLKAKGFKQKRSSYGKRYWEGIGIRQSEQSFSGKRSLSDYDEE